MLKLTDCLAELPESEHLKLANALGEALHQTRQATQCLTDVGQDSQHDTTIQLFARLSTVIERLQVARGIVQRRACRSVGVCEARACPACGATFVVLRVNA